MEGGDQEQDAHGAVCVPWSHGCPTEPRVPHGHTVVPESSACAMKPYMTPGAVDVPQSHLCPICACPTEPFMCHRVVRVPWNWDPQMSHGAIHVLWTHKCPLQMSRKASISHKLTDAPQSRSPLRGAALAAAPPGPILVSPPPESAQSLHPCSSFQAGSQASHAPGCLWHVQTRGNRDVSLCG